MSSEIKSTNYKAKDGTAGISIADSSGRVTVTETNPSITLGTNSTIGIIKNVNGSASNQSIQLGGTTSDDGMFYAGYYRVSAATTVTITTPTEFDANSCVVSGLRNSADNTTTQGASGSSNVVYFTGANTLTLENSSGYVIYIYFCLIKFK